MKQTQNLSDSEQHVIHQRRHPRVRISAPFPCSLVIIGPDRQLVAGQGDIGIVYDVSTKGARVMTEAVISPGDRIAMSLRLPHHPSATVIDLAAVRWSRSQTYGIEFEGLSLVAGSRLQKFMTRASKSVAAPAC